MIEIELVRLSQKSLQSRNVRRSHLTIMIVRDRVKAVEEPYHLTLNRPACKIPREFEEAARILGDLVGPGAELDNAT